MRDRWPCGSAFQFSDTTSNVYIDTFPNPGRKHRVSIDGGFNPSWTPDGSAIRFVFDSKILEASVQIEPSPRTGIPEELFAIDADIRGGDRSLDDRFLVIKPVAPEGESRVTVVLNALRELDGKR